MASNASTVTEIADEPKAYEQKAAKKIYKWFCIQREEAEQYKISKTIDLQLKKTEKKLQKLQKLQQVMRRKIIQTKRQVYISKKHIKLRYGKTIQEKRKICKKLKLRWNDGWDIVWEEAIKKYAHFHGKKNEEVTIRDVANSSAGIQGWYEWNPIQ